MKRRDEHANLAPRRTEHQASTISACGIAWMLALQNIKNCTVISSARSHRTLYTHIYIYIYCKIHCKQISMWQRSTSDTDYVKKHVEHVDIDIHTKQSISHDNKKLKNYSILHNKLQWSLCSMLPLSFSSVAKEHMQLQLIAYELLI